MKINICLIFICFQLFDALKGDPEENLTTDEKQAIDKQEKSESINSMPNVYSERVRELTNTLKEVGEKLDEQKSETDLTPYEEIFDHEERKNPQKISKITTALKEFLLVYKQSNDKRRNSDENLSTVEKYMKGKALLSSSKLDKSNAYILLLEASVEGNIDAKVEVSWGLLFGVHIPQNIELAKEIFEELSQEGDPEGHTGMAILYSIGLGVSFDQRRSLVHFTVAALGGSTWARMALGYRYLYGLAVSTSCEKALLYYGLAADSVAADYQPFGGASVQRVSLVEEFDDPSYKPARIGKDLKDYYEMQAENGDINAQVGLGQLYYRGSKGIERNVHKSLHYFQLAAANKNSLGIAFIGRIYLEGGDNVEVDLPKAYKYLKKSADLGNPAGEAGLGMMYLEGKYVEKDYTKALFYFSRSASRGWVEGIVELAKMYYSGLGVTKNVYLAKRYFLYAAQAGNIISYYYLGQMFANGIGTMRSCMTAVELLKGVSERGKWGNLFLDGYELCKENRNNEAFAVYATLAEMGYMVGQSNAAFVLDEKPVDLPLKHREFQNASINPEWVRYRKALQYWSRSALQGYNKAVLKIGDHHYYGQGTQVDYEVASIYYKYCAERFKNAQAMFNLGYMHEHGLGCRRDAHLARRRYDLAMEVSDDAWIPVGLALIKLTLVDAFSFFASNDWTQSLKVFDENLGPYWDICSIMLLTFLLARLIYRRILHRELVADVLNWPIFA